MSKSLNLIKYFLYVGIFAVPFLAFIVSSSMFFPFITGKNFSFRIIVEIMTALWLILLLFDAKYKPRKSCVLAMLAIFYGVFQLFGILQTHQGSRLDATLGNASYLAVYMVFHIFLALAFFYRAKDFRKWIYFFVIILESFVLYHTATRGAILGLIGGLL